jgi:peptide/nickel transport system permease protein
MVRYLASRLAQLLITLLGITLVTFAIAQTMGFDRPLPEQYALWLGRVVRLDFGRSSRDGRPVAEKLREAAPVTAVLGLLAIAVVLLIGIPLGIEAGLRPGSPFEVTTRGALLVLHSLPNFWLAVMLLSAAGTSSWMPVLGDSAGTPSALDVLGLGRGLVAPVLCLAVGALAIVARQVSGSLREVMGADFIRAARAHGLSERAIVLRHALPNAALPTINVVGTLLPHLLGGSVIVESIFGLPGLGLLGFQALGTRDYDALMGVTVVGALCTLLANLVTDLVARGIDPRLAHAPRT